MFELAPAIPPRGDVDWCWYLRRQGTAGEALERALHDIGVLQPGGWADWQPSTMTDTGAPVEMIFTPDPTELSLRTEVDDPGKDPSGRVAKACNVISRLGGTPPPTALLDVISAAQGGANLRYGAWLGLHRCPNTLGLTLYAEVPPEATDLVGLFSSVQIAPTLAKLGDDVQLVMIGYATHCAETTLYFETTQSPEKIVPMIVAPAQVSQIPLLRDISDMFDAGAPQTRSLMKFGFSYRFHAGDQPPTLKLYVRAKDVFGSDEMIEQLVRNYPGDHVAAYAGLMEQLQPAPGGKTNHGKVGLQANGDECPMLSICVSAPWLPDGYQD